MCSQADRSRIVHLPRQERFAWICPYSGEGEVFQYVLTAFEPLKI
ncbi:MAG: hypothetical protein ACRD1G_10380 [Acidimicrobiales bacterium]